MVGCFLRLEFRRGVVEWVQGSVPGEEVESE